MSALKEYLGKKVRVVTTDARLFEGTLSSFDHSTNVILSDTIERIIYPNEENQMLLLGVYLLRGGSVVCVGEVDELADIDWMTINGEELKGTKNPL
ncbi:Sm-like ribonucleo protein [Metschnikowia bicuspidata var. bicuspidata NRRL YB-4993]|uniref:LSM2-LSM8 complex subunit LSM8 n=1 Tax=Metschnikowia bicuspidata var. bicuspidata NRRL YB-4993 TaxID=869754 RepID=A0A1A0H807_9ASCO|nr:Sm-like ribonucleo protein [Metschnikowia bicuspidata var. bicuspidata NRRL YB-4993]OBA20234.1 Sm-like ribonucleo protein [Metschnikowia bicuspidata var. bicuspidata NRRL YB-4993]